MLAEKGKAIAGETMANPLQNAFSSKYYHKHSTKSRKKPGGKNEWCEIAFWHLCSDSIL